MTQKSAEVAQQCETGWPFQEYVNCITFDDLFASGKSIFCGVFLLILVGLAAFFSPGYIA